MKQIMAVAVSFAVLLTVSTLHAETAAEAAVRTQAAIANGAAPAWMSPNLPEDVQGNIHNKAQTLAQSLKLDNDQKQARIAAILAEHYGRVWAWHQQVDKELDAAWAAWDNARDNLNGEKDELKALTIMVEQIDPIYAEFAPQIQGVLQTLRRELIEEQLIALLNRITRSPGVDRTYNAYLEMVPEMKDEEKTIIRQRLEQARLDSLAARDDKRIVKIFKKYKVRNEFSIDYFGYGYRQRYKDWVNRSK